MQFTTRKRRQSPTVIIISLIDVLIVVLIFLMVTTTFKQQPAVTLALPESSQPKTGAAPNALVVTISKQGPLYLNKDPVTLDKLKADLVAAVRANSDTTLGIRADTDAAVGLLIKVRDAAQAANIKMVSVYVHTGTGP
ncbi:MAG TPA: biopolymer transporter ExbD [Candidatus Saccharimonadales bacterium]|nr:biopolymer transporter ExbD [Candidatus Saccharimonadales bacterium]